VTTRRRQRGFNVIEIVVTLVIIALVTTFGLPMYSLWLQNSQLRASAESIMAGLQHARSEAVRLNDTQGVRFALGADNAWSVYRVADPGTPLQQGGGTDLAKNALVTPDPAITEVTFTPLGQTNPVVTLNINVTHVDTSQKCIADGGEIRCLRVQVRPGGIVRLCDTNPAIPAGDPRRCL
jgi:type IV fimbrial biogenesis protein FimT